MKYYKDLNKNMNSPAVGIDIGESESVAHFVSASGDTLEHFSFKMNDEGFNEFKKKIPVNARIAFEASGLAYPVLKKLQNLGYVDITVAHPKELAWIVKSKKKNDHVDSIKLAKLHLVDMLPKSHLLSQDEQIFRDLLIQRVKIGQQTSKIKNSIIGYLKREDLFNTLPESDNNFSVKRIKAIKNIKFGDQRDLVLKTMIEQLEFLQKQERPIEKEIRKIARENDDVKLLMTIKGVDYYLASLLSSYIGDITRFENKDRLASFFGVVPANRDSSSIKRRGHMSKEGSSVARWALSIAVDTVMRYNEAIAQYYKSVKERTGSGKQAHVSTMHKLVMMIYHMLSKREEWNYAEKVLTEKKLRNLEN